MTLGMELWLPVSATCLSVCLRVCVCLSVCVCCLLPPSKASKAVSVPNPQSTAAVSCMQAGHQALFLQQLHSIYPPPSPPSILVINGILHLDSCRQCKLFPICRCVSQGESLHQVSALNPCQGGLSYGGRDVTTPSGGVQHSRGLARSQEGARRGGQDKVLKVQMHSCVYVCQRKHQCVPVCGFVSVGICTTALAQPLTI